MKYTHLSKKEQGRIRYERHYTNVGRQRERAVRVRNSDIAPTRLGDGAPMVITKQVFSHSAKKRTWDDALMAAISQSRKQDRPVEVMPGVEVTATK